MNKAVLVGGLPRSGTNLVRRIVGSHSDIAMPPVEFMFFQKLATGRTVQDILSADEFRKRYEVDVSDLYGETPEAVYRELLTRYARHIGKPVAGEKSPRNELNYDRILKSLSGFDTRFIQIVRNPLDVIASFKYAPFRKNVLPDETEIAALVSDWVRSLSVGLARAFTAPASYRVIKYETLTADPEQETRKLCEFLGVDFQGERMLNLADFSEHKDNTSFAGDDSNAQTGDSAGRVRNRQSRKSHLSPAELDIVTGLCGELALAFGYDDEEFSRPDSPVNLPGPPKKQPGVRRKLKGAVRRVLGMR